MDAIRKQVQLAQRYLNGERLLRSATWGACIGLGVAAIAIAIPKLVAIPFLQDKVSSTRWSVGCLAAGLIAGVIVAGLVAWVRRVRTLEAAIAVDTRFNLRERLSSALSLPEEELHTAAGEALMRDALRSADRIDVRDRFSFGLHWRNLTPLLPLVLILGLWLFVENATIEESQASEQLTAAERQRIEDAQEMLRKKLNEEVRRAEELGLKEAEVALREVDRVMRDRKKEDRPKEDTLVRLNDAKQTLEERVKKLGDAKSMRDRLSKLEPEKSGPADKAAQALRDGKIDEAVQELERLAEKAKSGELSPEDQQKLSQQLADLQKQLQSQADQQREKEQTLQQQLQQAQNEGDQQRTESLKQQLAQQQQQNAQTQQLDSLAECMGQACQSMSNGANNNAGNSQASQSLSEAAQQLQEMNANFTEVEMLEGMLDQISQCKGMLQNPSGQTPSQGNAQLAQGGTPSQSNTQAGAAAAGAGNQPSGSGQGGQGSGGNSQGQGQGNGNGAGQGNGARAENENPTDFQDSQVAGNPMAGEAVMTGSTGGVNVSGKSRSEVYQEVQTSLSSKSDPLTEQTLPRRQRDQAREYFRQFSNAEKKSSGGSDDSFDNQDNR